MSNYQEFIRDFMFYSILIFIIFSHYYLKHKMSFIHSFK